MKVNPDDFDDPLETLRACAQIIRTAEQCPRSRDLVNWVRLRDALVGVVDRIDCLTRPELHGDEDA